MGFSTAFTIVGGGYVGFSTALLLAKQNEVTILDVNKTIVDMINSGKSHLKEKALQKQLDSGECNLHATTDPYKAYSDCEFVLLAVPTNFDEKRGCFDTSILDETVDQAFTMSKATLIIRSTIPVGYTRSKIDQYGNEGAKRILFSPEFMREGQAFYDVSHPTRIIIGSADEAKENAMTYAGIMLEACIKAMSRDRYPKALIPNVIFEGTSEAEAVKLFANTYLAMRVAFFNELDAFAENEGLNTEQIINGICVDPRIGEGYANPSFGYGGYCLPKDTKQLAGQMRGRTAKLIGAITESNNERIVSVANRIRELTDGTIGIYGIAMKAGSDNSRESAILKIAEDLSKDRDCIIYNRETTPLCNAGELETTNDLNEFLNRADIIVANRISAEDRAVLKDVPPEKIYTRDIFGEG